MLGQSLRSSWIESVRVVMMTCLPWFATAMTRGLTLIAFIRFIR